MSINLKLVILILCLTISTAVFGQSDDADSSYLAWNEKQLRKIGHQFREDGEIGSLYGLRGLKTNRAVNYEIRATLMSPEMIRASARLVQIRDRLTDEQTIELVKEAEAAGDLIVMIELDPNEGSGVIPLDWRVFLQPKGAKGDSKSIIPGTKSPHLKKIQALSGVFRRDYNYDLFFVSFPLVDEDGKPLISPEVLEIEVLVGIYNSEGHVSWRMPESVRAKIRSLSSENSSIEEK